MPFLYLSLSQLTTLRSLAQHLAPLNVAATELQQAILRQTDPSRHKVVREITFEGSEADLREQVGRSLPEGQQERGHVQFTVRTISNSLPQVSD